MNIVHDNDHDAASGVPSLLEAGKRVENEPFPLRLHAMTEYCARHHPHRVEWSQDGCGMVIKDMAYLEFQILCCFFPNPFRSVFEKELRRHSFVEHRSGTVSIWFHTELLFRRDDPESAAQISPLSQTAPLPQEPTAPADFPDPLATEETFETSFNEEQNQLEDVSSLIVIEHPNNHSRQCIDDRSETPSIGPTLCAIHAAREELTSSHRHSKLTAMGDVESETKLLNIATEEASSNNVDPVLSRGDDCYGEEKDATRALSLNTCQGMELHPCLNLISPTLCDKVHRFGLCIQGILKFCDCLYPKSSSLLEEFCSFSWGGVDKLRLVTNNVHENFLVAAASLADTRKRKQENFRSESTMEELRCSLRAIDSKREGCHTWTSLSYASLQCGEAPLYKAVNCWLKCLLENRNQDDTACLVFLRDVLVHLRLKWGWDGSLKSLMPILAKAFVAPFLFTRPHYLTVMRGNRAKNDTSENDNSTVAGDQKLSFCGAHGKKKKEKTKRKNYVCESFGRKRRRFEM